MMKTWMKWVIITGAAFLLVKGDFGLCEPVKGYSSYIQLLPGGKDKQESNFSLIEKAKQEVKVLEEEKKKREIKFERPVDIHYLNSKYTMLSFEVFFRPLENSRFSTSPSVYALLFEGTGRNGLNRYTSRYIKWIGRKDIDDYKAAGVPDFCGYFRRSGVEDCLPETDGKSGSAGSKQAKTNSSEDRLNGDWILSGKVKSDFIDPAIARKKDVDKAMQASNDRFDRLKSELKAYGENLKAMELQLKEQPDKDAEKRKLSDERMAAYDDRMKKIEENLEKQMTLARDMEKKIESVSTLLQGVSRNRNTIVISGANVQIVNGTGATLGEANGTGNLIIGYNEKKPGESLTLGSHTLISPDTASPELYTPKERTAPDQEKTDKGFFSGRCFIGSVFE